MAAPAIHQYTPAAFLSGGGPPSGAGIVIPATGAGNGIIICLQGDSNTIDHMATDVFTNTGEHFTLAAASQSGACSEIWYLPAGAGGATKIYWTGGPTVTASIGVYELVGGIVLHTAGHVDWNNISPNVYSFNHTNIPGPTLTTTVDTLIILTGIGCPSFGAGSGQSVAAPYVTDFPLTNTWGIQAHLSAVAGSYTSSWAREFNLDYWAVSGAAFVSTILPGRIRVNKVTNPLSSTQQFSFTSNFSGPFSLRNGESFLSDLLAPGTYHVSEDAAFGWIPTTSADPTAIVIDGSGATVTIVFTNSTGVPTTDDCVVSRTRNAFLLIEKSPQSNQTYQMKAVNYADAYYEHDGDFDLTGTGGSHTEGGGGDGSSFGFGTSFGVFGG